MKDTINTIYIKKSNFRTQEEFYSEVNKQVSFLLENKYAICLYYSGYDDNIACIEFSSTDATIVEVMLVPMWLTPQEINLVTKTRLSKVELPKIPTDINDDDSNNNNDEGFNA